MERDLAQALKDREYVKDAIRRGLAGEITQEVLEEVETRLRTLRKQLETLQTPEFTAGFVAGTVLAKAIEARLQQLDEVLDWDVERAKGLLHDLLEGLLALEGALPAGITGYHGSGGTIFPSANTGGGAGLVAPTQAIQIVPGAGNR